MNPSNVRQTHTFVTLEIPRPHYENIHEKLSEAGYQHAFMEHHQSHGKPAIDMQGIALVAGPLKFDDPKDKDANWIDSTALAITKNLQAELEIATRQMQGKPPEQTEVRLTAMVQCAIIEAMHQARRRYS